jgi:hypothetical protein
MSVAHGAGGNIKLATKQMDLTAYYLKNNLPNAHVLHPLQALKKRRLRRKLPTLKVI